MVTQQQSAPQSAGPMAPAQDGSRRPRWWRAIGAGAFVATVVNLLVYAITSGTGAPLAHTANGVPGAIATSDVVVLSVVPLVVATAAAAVVARWWKGAIRVGQVAGPALTLPAIRVILTIRGVVPLETDTATQNTLSIMYLVLVPVLVWVLEAGWRTNRQPMR